MSFLMLFSVAVTEIRSLKLDSCKYINDEALQLLILVNSPLRHLQISNNKNVSDKGLLSLSNCGYVTFYAILIVVNDTEFRDNYRLHNKLSHFVRSTFQSVVLTGV